MPTSDASTAPAAAPPETMPRHAAPVAEPDRLQSVLARCVAARAAGRGGVLQRKISFASYIWEALGWYPEVPKAIIAFESLKQELQQLRQAEVHKEIRGWLTAQSADVAAFVKAWDDKKPVPTDDRATVIAAISTHRGTLATLSGQIATKQSEIAARELEAAEQRKRDQQERAEKREREKQAQLERERLADEQRVKEQQAKEEQSQREAEAARLKQVQAQQAREQAEREALEREASLRQELAELGARYGPEAVARRRKIRRELREREAAAEDELMKAAQSKLKREMEERHKAELKGLKSKQRSRMKESHEREVEEAQGQADKLRDEALGRREKQARADENAELLVQIGLVEPEVERLLSLLDGFDTTEGLDRAAEHAAAARAAAGRARAVIAEDISAAGDELATATAAVGSLADTVTQAGVKRATVERRCKAVRDASLKLHQAWPPRKHLEERLAAHDKLTPAQRIASLTDDTVVGGIAMLEFETESAAEVDGDLRAISSRVKALNDAGLFRTWATATVKSMFKLGWEDLARSVHDEQVPSGIAALRAGLVQMERLKSIRGDIEKLELPVLRDELLSHADRPPPESWELHVQRLAELEQELADAREVDKRRAGVAGALAGATLDTSQRHNIETWLEANAKLSLTDQRTGLADENEKHGLKRIQAAVARYNSVYRGTQEAEAAATAKRREAQALRDRSTSQLIRGTRTLRQLYDDGLISRGRLVETFKSYYDRGEGEFSVEYTIEGLNNILLHAHCEPNGTPKAGNAVHWKERRYKYVVGQSYPVPDNLRPILLDAPNLMKSNRDRNPEINWR